MGATLVGGGGATFRFWAPWALAVILTERSAARAAGPKRRPAHAAVCVTGTGSSGYKRDPYARELATDAAHGGFALPEALRQSTSGAKHRTADAARDS
jgi:hypothetical protein